MTGNSLGVTLRIIWHNFLLDIWHYGCFGSLIGKGRPFTARSMLFPPKTYGWNYVATRRRTAKDFAGRALNENQKTARSYQRGSRNSRPPDAFAFCLRYSAKVASARFSSETDFCSRAVLMASQNEVSICVS